MNNAQKKTLTEAYKAHRAYLHTIGAREFRAVIAVVNSDTGECIRIDNRYITADSNGRMTVDFSGRIRTVYDTNGIYEVYV